MAWVRPSRSRPNRPSPNRPSPRQSGAGQEGGVAGNSGGAGGSSCRLVDRRAGRWGHEAGVETGSEGSRGSVPPACSDRHIPQLPQGIQTPSPCIRWKRRNGVSSREMLPVPISGSMERPPLINDSSVRRKGSWLPSAPARTLSMSRSARAMVAARRGGREHAERRRGGWPHQQRCQATAKNGLGHKANSLDRKCQLLAATLSLI